MYMGLQVKSCLLVVNTAPVLVWRSAICAAGVSRGTHPTHRNCNLCVQQEYREIHTQHTEMPASSRPGEAVFAVERVNAELFTLTYGAIVRQLLTDFEEVEEVNKQLDTMGYNIGIRLIDDFLAKSNITRCNDFKETADVIAKVGFKMFLGVSATVANWSIDNSECSLILDDNPLVDFVELPETCQGLYYCNILCGVIRGALEMVSMRTEVKFVKDVLRGDDIYEMRLKLLEQVPEEYPYKDDD